MAEKFLIIDSNSVIHRAYHALPPLKTKKGELVNAIYGFLLVLFKALKELSPHFVAAAFDVPGPTFRHKEFKKYKEKRPPAAAELYQQISKTKEVLRAFNIPVFEKQGFEADDIIGTITRLISKKQIFPKPEIFILSGDLDTLQLVDNETKVWTMKKGIKETSIYAPEQVKKRYGGLSPAQLIDFRALKGDPSDNIPGVPGIGEKTAISLIRDFGTLEVLYEKIQKPETNLQPKLKERLTQAKEQAFFCRKLSQIKRDVPIYFQLKDCRFGGVEETAIIELLKKFEFYTIISRLKELKGLKSRRQTPGKEQAPGEIEQLYKDGLFSKEVYEIEKKLTPLIKEMEENGIKLDCQALEEFSKNLQRKIKTLESEIYKITQIHFNLNSPRQVGELLFNKLKLSPKNLKRTAGGITSTGSPELEKIKNLHPVVGLILKYRELFKLKSGFCDSLKNLVEPKDKRIHPHFHQLGAVTGRMSCSEPNLQNIPLKGELAKDIRKCFVPEHGFRFLSADYSQMELRIAAFLARDKKMMAFFQEGKDIHIKSASQLFHIGEEKVSEQQRNLVKALNFGMLYGLGSRGLAERTGLSLKEAEQFIKRYFEQFPALAQYKENLIKEVQTQGFVETFFGRKRFLGEINSIDKRLKNQAERMAINTKIQGTASDIIKLAMLELKDKAVIDENCRLNLQIHDELLFEVRQDKIKEKAEQIKEIMENEANSKIPLKVEMKSGRNWAEMNTFSVQQSLLQP